MKRIALAVAVLALTAGCSSSSDPVQTATPKTSVATVTQDGLTVELYTATKLETGLTPLWVSVKDASSGQKVANATVAVMPMMTMNGTPTTEHTAPMIGMPTVDAEGDWRCDVVFQMQSSDMGSWRIDVTISRPGAADVSVSFPVTVPDSGCAKVFTYTDPNTQAATRYVASMDFLESPKVGMNPVVITLHTRQDMMTFPPVEHAAIAVHPWMPSMVHGSQDTTATETSPGVYEAQVAFTMKGDWETTLTIEVGGVTVGAPKFLTTF